jgi:hypothetical protein
LNATTRSPPGSASRAVKGLQASGEDRFATGEDEEKRRVTKTEVPTAKTDRRRRREAKSDEDRGAYGEDLFATGEDKEKRREAKTRAPTAKSKTRREGVGE